MRHEGLCRNPMKKGHHAISPKCAEHRIERHSIAPKSDAESLPGELQKRQRNVAIGAETPPFRLRTDLGGNANRHENQQDSRGDRTKVRWQSRQFDFSEYMVHNYRIPYPALPALP